MYVYILKIPFRFRFVGHLASTTRSVACPNLVLTRFGWEQFLKQYCNLAPFLRNIVKHLNPRTLQHLRIDTVNHTYTYSYWFILQSGRRVFISLEFLFNKWKFKTWLNRSAESLGKKCFPVRAPTEIATCLRSEQHVWSVIYLESHPNVCRYAWILAPKIIDNLLVTPFQKTKKNSDTKNMNIMNVTLVLWDLVRGSFQDTTTWIPPGHCFTNTELGCLPRPCAVRGNGTE